MGMSAVLIGLGIWLALGVVVLGCLMAGAFFDLERDAFEEMMAEHSAWMVVVSVVLWPWVLWVNVLEDLKGDDE